MLALGRGMLSPSITVALIGCCAGHFAALEKPELLMADMRAFFAEYH